MPAVLTEASRLSCDHEGTMTTSGQAKLRVLNSRVLTTSGSRTWPIAGCTQTGGPPTPCTNLTSVGSGRSNKLRVMGIPVLMANLAGVTNGSPTGTVSAQANQGKLTAS